MQPVDSVLFIVIVIFFMYHPQKHCLILILIIIIIIIIISLKPLVNDIPQTSRYISNTIGACMDHCNVRPPHVIIGL